MANVKCKYCKKKIQKEGAFVISGKRPSYYCDEECHRLHTMSKVKAIDLACEIIHCTKTKYLKTEMESLIAVVGEGDLIKYLLSEGQTISDRLLSIEFVHPRAKLKYFFSWVNNDMEKFLELKDPVKCKVEPVKGYTAPKRSPIKSMDDLLKEILGELEE